MGMITLALELDAAAALAVVRATAYATDQTVDDVAADVLDGRVKPDELRAPGD
jgi:hypothetical protein